mgnify:CR=1 FL=1
MKIAAIVPAYNEAKNIGSVLSVLTRSPLIDEVIVVNDGSTDNTAEVAARYRVRVIDLPANVGKGGAMKIGANNTDAEILLFIDADLIGLTLKHIADMLEPVRNGRAAMSVGIFDDGRFATDLAQKLAPFLSGQRAMLHSIIDSVPEIENKRYGVEVALSRYAEKEDLPVVHVRLKNMAQVMKEEKLGFWKGFRARLRMYWEIIRLSW